MRRMGRGHALRVLALLFGLAALLAVSAPAATARSRAADVEADVLARINAARSAAGRAPLTSDARLVPLARTHAGRLARSGQLFHRNYTTVLQAVNGRRAGEVVGVAFDGASLVSAWLGSSVHRSIVLGKGFRLAGVGVARGTYAGAAAWYVTVDVAG